MSYPSNLKYTKQHEWVKIEGNTGTIGVTKYAIDQLGDVVYLELPKVGSVFNAHDVFGTIESTKTVSDLYSPVTGKITEVNTAITETPENLAHDAFENGWLVKVEMTQPPSDLLTAAEYESYIKDQN